MDNISVLLVDDEQGLCDMLTAVLKKEGFRFVRSAGTGEEAMRLLKELDPDVIILDVMLPDEDGFEVCRKIRKITEAPILFLTARDTDLDKLMGFGIGGDDYMTKPFNPLEVVARIKARLKYKLKQERSAQSRITQLDFGYFRLDLEAGELIVNGKEVECPAREWELLVFLCRHPNRIFSTRQLYESVWNEPYLGDEKTVVIHIFRLRKRMEPDPGNPRFLVNVRGLGYKMLAPRKEQE
ncbi:MULTISPECIES: response regulator transcription factor [Paenibacillus]|uniref:Two component transcriptional regulator, winged helix family n=2 Tax=Paenibacillus lactis TaxID=228574 RepID=G4HNL0_9BACL|nr:response regulator transcription factor [Paenibacillus lactis]EHB50175.1 two component transcriptional regulator, winged helix family [Paenibacillus lactis 154]MBP1896368.1 DNA-binding response OmpR family regulator [Paenibacillus lactis]MCM3497398.1 response regulator transcription factor [Paenibacillus lactis]GIO94875.1 DNA-binding response regulator [Paenibacillus lactis]HAG01029.1 DNA-binding response regulator [Paenibacillus lactis]